MCKVLNVIAMILVFIGGLNWGLIGFFNWDLVAAIFGAMSLVTNIIYALVGLSALYLIIWSLAKGHCSCGCKCESKPKAKKRK
jgi:hypothetical protein